MNVNVQTLGRAKPAPTFNLTPNAHVIRSDAEAIEIAQALATDSRWKQRPVTGNNGFPLPSSTGSPRAACGGSPCPRPMAAQAFPS